jgi:hypothetical protein
MSSTATIARESTAPRRSLIRAANAVLVLAAIILILLSAYFVHAHKARYVMAGPAMLALGCLILLAAKPAIRVFAAALMIGSVAGLYATELISHVVYNDDLPYERYVRDAAVTVGIQYDPRTRLEAILESRSQGTRAYPPFYPYLLLDDPLKVDSAPTIPLGNHSEAFVVVCNEGGQYLTYNTDEHGFPNPDGLWSNSLDIAMVGDSNAVGECVPGICQAKTSLVDILRVAHPAVSRCREPLAIHASLHRRS